MIEVVVMSGVLLSLLAAAAAIDIRSHRLPDLLNLAILGAGLIATAVLGRDLVASALGVLMGYGLVAGANALYRWRRGRDGIGMGDAKLLAAGGAWVGWASTPFVLLVAASAAILALSIARIAGRTVNLTDRVPFGPFLALGVFGAWIAQLAYLSPSSG